METGQGVLLFLLSWERVSETHIFRRAATTDLGVTRKFSWVGEFVNRESGNAEIDCVFETWSPPVITARTVGKAAGVLLCVLSC